MKKRYSSIRGTSDFSPASTRTFNTVIRCARLLCERFGYEEIVLPLMEEEGLFIRGVGQVTDIIEKQLFRVTRDKEDYSHNIVLRPEGTAQVIRFYLEKALYKRSNFHKFFYIGPMFRGERPQKGRLRQFYHIGAEAIGSASPYLDAETIQLAALIVDEAGAKEKKIKINTLGCGPDKERFSAGFIKELGEKKKRLCEDCQRRLEHNPLRVLDCKRSQCKEVVRSLDIRKRYLCEKCKGAFMRVRQILEELGVAYTYDPYLVRGLDYYTNTVFEITSPKLGAQDALGAGGGYNNLVEDLGGPDIPAIGFALGIERMMLVLDQEEEKRGKVIFFLPTGSRVTQETFLLIHACRQAGIMCDMDYYGKSLKGQLRAAQKKGAPFVVIVGEEEWERQRVIVKEMFSEGKQEEVRRDNLITVLKEKIAELA